MSKKSASERLTLRGLILKKKKKKFEPRVPFSNAIKKEERRTCGSDKERERDKKEGDKKERLNFFFLREREKREREIAPHRSGAEEKGPFLYEARINDYIAKNKSLSRSGTPRTRNARDPLFRNFSLKLSLFRIFLSREKRFREREREKERE